MKSGPDDKSGGAVGDRLALLESLKERIVHAAGRTTRVADAMLNERSHLCAFFASAEDEYAVMLPFIKEGLDRGEKAFHTIDPERIQDHVRRLSEADVDVEGRCRTKQLEIRSWNDVWLTSGTFEPAAPAAVFGQVQAEVARDGYRSTRFIGHMDWVTDQIEKVDELLLIEARWTEAQPRMPPNHGVCMYDIRKYRADTIVDVMRTHPQVIIGRTVFENPFFVPPEEFIREVEGRINRRTLR